MPLGASITDGQRGDGQTSNDVSHNGYRKPLRDQLRSRGYNVNMIGCVSSGQMRDKQHEGHRGFLITEVAAKVSCAIDQKPNLVLINAGTNDALRADQNGGVSFAQGAQGRMKDMIDDILSLVPDVTVILSTLLPNGNAAANNYAGTINAGFRSLVTSYQSAGKKVQLADMNTGFIVQSDLPDGTHPTDAGYKKMAAVWDKAFVAAVNKGWIKNPINTGKPDDVYDCNTSPASFSGATQTQRGSGADDGTYAHASQGMGTVTSDSLHENSNSATKGQWVKNYHFAQLVNAVDRGQESDELVRILDTLQPVADTGLPKFSFKQNNGGSFASSWTTFDPKMGCNNRGAHWGDVNNDGLDDFICISPDGTMYVSINKGGNPPTFEYLDNVKSGEATQEFVRLGDIDGDGRLDYCVIQGTGLYCWRNAGVADKPTWETMVGGVAFDFTNIGDAASIRLVDINGDFRSDIISISATGKTRIFINQRGTKDDGPGLKPHWIEASAAHGGGFADRTVDYFKFGRIYGSGRADYIVVKETNVKDGSTWKHTYDFEVYKNTGNGGKKVKGDGVYYCDMFGRGHDDYLWVYEAGNVNLFENTGNLPNWKGHNEIFNVGRDRKGIHFGDWNGDGLCDILAVDKKSGAVDWWENTWDATKVSPTFAYRGQAIAGNCAQGWGVSRYDLGVRFADIDGDARVDYLCLDTAGTTSAILNTEKGFSNVGQIKYTIGKDRAETRFADVNNDGKADYLTVDKKTGQVSIYTNQGQNQQAMSVQGVGDSSFTWVEQKGMWMDGVDRGANMFFARMVSIVQRSKKVYSR
ncbi:hypothetical protein SLS60_003298 [Paraconiothyrium brasiliense]|uniref:SGNH hydrolase-type esterase domain-containing protein n=1 Tax=Paraconiothyrium brasiliense TaxID=300254 RepID=A0ABR3RVA0_9PLEO